MFFGSTSFRLPNCILIAEESWWIFDSSVFLEEEGEEIEEGEGRSKSITHDRVSIDNIIDGENTDVIETRAEEPENIPPLM